MRVYDKIRRGPEEAISYEKGELDIKQQGGSLMVWTVFCSIPSNGRLGIANVFLHAGFCKDFIREAKECTEKESFASKLEASLRYHFSCKSEWEIVISPWLKGKDSCPMKIDAYSRIYNNWEPFIEYCWAHRFEMGKDRG